MYTLNMALLSRRLTIAAVAHMMMVNGGLPNKGRYATGLKVLPLSFAICVNLLETSSRTSDTAFGLHVNITMQAPHVLPPVTQAYSSNVKQQASEKQEEIDPTNRLKLVSTGTRTPSSTGLLLRNLS